MTGVALTIIGAFAVPLIVPEHSRRIFNDYDQFKPFIRLKELRKYKSHIDRTNWIILLILYFFRYVGPVISGFSISIIAIMVLYTHWVTDQEVKRLNSYLFSESFEKFPECFNSVLTKWILMVAPVNRNHRLSTEF